MPKKKRNTGLPKITQLPSGAYHAKLYVGTDETGKRIYQSFTNYDYDQLVLEIVQFKAHRKEEQVAYRSGKRNMTLGIAFDQYIESKSAVLSPSTIVGYRKIRRTNFQDLMSEQIDKLTQNQIQISVNREALTLSPKSIRNAHGLLTAVLRVFRPDFVLHTSLPQKVKADIQIPTEDEIKALMLCAKGSDMEIPLYLAACCGMRRSEISALTWDCIDLKKGTLTIRHALVLNEQGKVVKKGTKTTAGTRTIRLFPVVLDALKAHKLTQSDDQEQGYITISPNQITKRFPALIKQAGIRHFRFHDLRHYTISVMLSLNIPKNYIADYVGHETEDMIDRVYGHIMQSKKTSVEDLLNQYYSTVFNN